MTGRAAPSWRTAAGGPSARLASQTVSVRVLQPSGEDAGGESREEDQSGLHLGVPGATLVPPALDWRVL